MYAARIHARQIGLNPTVSRRFGGGSWEPAPINLTADTREELDALIAGEIQNSLFESARTQTISEILVKIKVSKDGVRKVTRYVWEIAVPDSDIAA